MTTPAIIVDCEWGVYCMAGHYSRNSGYSVGSPVVELPILPLVNHILACVFLSISAFH